MKAIKQDSDIKNTFYAFLEHVLTTYGKKNDLYYLIENSPYEDRRPITGIDKTIYAINPEHMSIAIISILSDECLHFSSFRDFKYSINKNNKLKKWLKQHFTNYSEFNPLELTLVRENLDYSFLFIGYY
ncbi:MAG: hypothetical protein AB8W37_02980 [Arsenophonus endosymbiont of Dermacentor nuttalli]